MKIPRRLKEITLSHKNISIDHHKRGFILVKINEQKINEQKMFVDIGQVVSIEQWEQLRRDISIFAKKKN